MVKSVLLLVCTSHKDAKSVVNLLTLRIIAGTINPIDTEHPVFGSKQWKKISIWMTVHLSLNLVGLVTSSCWLLGWLHWESSGIVGQDLTWDISRNLKLYSVYVFLSQVTYFPIKHEQGSIYVCVYFLHLAAALLSYLWAHLRPMLCEKVCCRL